MYYRTVKRGFINNKNENLLESIILYILSSKFSLLFFI